MFNTGKADSMKDEEFMPDEGVAVDGETMKAGESLSGENVCFLVSFLPSLSHSIEDGHIWFPGERGT